MPHAPSPHPSPLRTLRPSLTQLPSLEEIWWVSALGTASSLGYVLVALVLGLVYAGAGQGSIGGRPGTSPADKVRSKSGACRCSNMACVPPGRPMHRLNCTASHSHPHPYRHSA
jgi:hypothetical protein